MAKATNKVKEEKTTTPTVRSEAAQGGLPVTVGAEDGAWGGEDIGNDDIIIPKILLMQPMSELVTDGIARIGEFRSSLDKDQVLGDDKTPVELIVFGSFKTWIEFKDGEYLTTKKMTAENTELPQEEVMEDGSVITRDRVINYYCLNTKDIESGEPFPFVLSCRRTSYTAGKTIATHIKKLQMFKKPSAAKAFNLTSRKETNDKGTFFILDVEVKRDSTEKEMLAAYEWYKVLQKAKVRVDDSDLNKGSEGAADVHTAKTVSPESTQQVTV